jgi:hypothetical protein
MKMEVEPEQFATDPEGVALAQRINAYLPPQVSQPLGRPPRICAP